MEEDNYRFLTEAFEKEQAALDARAEQEAIKQIGNANGFSDYKDRVYRLKESIKKPQVEQLEKKWYTDFGGSQDAAKRLVEENKKQKEQQKHVIEINKEKQKSEEELNLNQNKGSKNIVQNTHEQLSEQKRREELKNRLREQFNQNAKNNPYDNSKGR